MVEENPYAVSESVSGFAPHITSTGFPADHYYVDGSLIMCGKAVELPAICVLTGTTEDLVQVRKTVTWVPKWIYLTLLAGLLILLIFYLLFRKECKARYYLSRRIRNRKRWMTFGAIAGFFGAFALMIAGADSQNGGVFVLSGFVCIVTSLGLLVIAQLPLTAVRHENGVRFWLKGFGQPFFDQLRAMYENPG